MAVMLLWFGAGYASRASRGSTTWQIAKGRGDACYLQTQSVACKGTEGPGEWVLSSKPIQGDWNLETDLQVSDGSSSGVLFEVQDDLSSGYLLTLDPKLTLWRIKNGDLASKSRELVDLHARVFVMAHQDDLAAAANAKLLANLGLERRVKRIRIVKAGANYTFWLNDQLVSSISNPIEESTKWKSAPEPESGMYGFALAGTGLNKATAISLKHIQLAIKDKHNPILKPGPKGSWDDAVIFTGSVMKQGDTYYLYFTGRDSSSKKDGGAVGVATSKDLVNWTENPGNPILRDDSAEGVWDYTLQAGGVVPTPDGKYALFYDGNNGRHQWVGVGVAFSNSPLGPFQRYEKNPVLKDGSAGEMDAHAIHLHTVMRQQDGTYVMLYTGNPGGQYTSGRRGDRGFLATSRDLIHWEKSKANPVFDLGPLGEWDDTHVRPKTLSKWHGWYYMFYEGTKNDGVFWWDQDGMARSKDLLHWERFPFNPILPVGTNGAYDSIVTEWPAALVDGDVLHVFYMCGPMINTRLMICKSTISSQALAAWDTAKTRQ
jgi:predicted GH43/DUF377 family glycosyl hydrolase